MASWLQNRVLRIKQTGGELLKITRLHPELGRMVTRQIPHWDRVLGRELRVQVVSDLSTLSPELMRTIVSTIKNHLEGLGNLQRWRVWQIWISYVRTPTRNISLSDLWSALPNMVLEWDDAQIRTWVQQADAMNDPAQARAFLHQESQRAQTVLSETQQHQLLGEHLPALLRYAQAHSGDWKDLISIADGGSDAFTDGVVIYLPSRLDCSLEEAKVHYRLEVTRLTAYFEFGTLELNPGDNLKRPIARRPDELPLEWLFRSFPNGALAQELFFILEDHRLHHLILQTYPGLSESFPQHRLQQWAEIAPKTEIDRILHDLTGVQANFKPSQESHPLVQQYMSVWMTVECSGVQDTIDRMHWFYDHAYNTLLKVDRVIESLPPIRSERLSSRNRRMVVQATQNSTISARSLAERFQTEKEHFQTDWSVDRGASHQGGLLSERDEPDFVPRPDLIDDERELLDGQFRYPEWDCTIQDMRPNWTRVLECTIQSDPSGIQFAEEVSLTYSMEMKRIKRLFQTIVTGQRTIQRGVSDGDTVEFDKWMASRIDRKLKRQPSEQLYSRTVLNHRDPAVAFLVDLSSSTNEITSEAKPILDVEKAALLLMAEALHGLGDPFAIYGWSGFGREQVVFYTAKSFNEPWSNQTRSKVGGLKWKLENRDGAAIRHAVAKMSSWKHTQKILIILSDGKPLDSGSSQYYDAYAQADTKQALQSARSAGITPFCVTIDPYGQDYLVDMYGPNRFMTIEDLSLFPEKLARLYANLTTN